MTVYNNGRKIKDIYYFGRKVKEAYSFGALVYKIGEETKAGVSTKGNDIIIHTTRVIWPKKSTTKIKPDGSTTQDPPTSIGPTTLNKEIVIPAAKDSFYDNIFDEETGSYSFIGYSPNLRKETSTYPSGYMGIYKGSGYETASIAAGTTSWTGLGNSNSGSFAWGNMYLSPTKEGEQELNPIDLATENKLNPSPSTWDIRLANLKIKIPSSYSNSQWYKCKLTAIVIKQKNGSIVATSYINKEMYEAYYEGSPEYTISDYLCTFNTVSFDKANAPYTINLVFEDVASYSSETYGVSVTGVLQGKVRKVQVTEYYDEEMVLEVDKMIYETIQEHEDGTEEVIDIQENTIISLTPASEYDPMSNTGIANIKVGEEGNVYDIVEFA